MLILPRKLNNMAKEKSHLAILDILRAVAAISVCLFHFNRNDDPVFAYGLFGVEVFFVISGFIIPLAMFWSSFKYADTLNFLIRRAIRLYPLFVIVAITELTLHWLGSSIFGYSGGKPDLTWIRAFHNFTMTCDFTSENWYSPVFWTLAIEAQYYLCIALTFPLLVSKKLWIRLCAVLLWIVPSYFVGYGESVFTWTAFFAIGILAFLYKQKLISTGLFYLFTALAMYSHLTIRGYESMWIGFGTSLLIIYAPAIRCKPLEWMGSLSYSLYLTHLIIGGAVIHHMRRLPDMWNDPYFVVIFATCISMLASWPLYRWAELPFHNLARRFKTKSRKEQLKKVETAD